MTERTRMMIATSAHTCVLATITRQFSAYGLCFRLTHQRKHSLAPQCCMLPLSCTGSLLIYSTALTPCSTATHEAFAAHLERDNNHQNPLFAVIQEWLHVAPARP